MIVFSRDLLSAQTNQAAGLATQKGSKMTVFFVNCWAWPCPQEDEDDGRNGDEDGDVTGWRRSKNSMLHVVKSHTVEVRKK
jgi:hypothetical protein